MEGYITFDGVVEPMVWGDKTYTIVALPDDVVGGLPKGTKRIEGEFAEHPVNLALTRAPVLAQVFVYTGATFLREAGLTPGEFFEARIKPADPNYVEVPEDVMAALRAANLSADWDMLSPGQRRARLHQINTAKRADTRAKRIAKLTSDLR